MKSAIFCVTSSLLFGLVMNSRAEAAGFSLPPDIKLPADQDYHWVSFPAGETNNFTLNTADTNGRYTLSDAVIPPGAGPEPHIHHREGEWFYVEEGDLDIGMGDNTYTEGQTPGVNAPKDHLHIYHATPGTLLYGRVDQLHFFKNNGTTPAKMLSVWAPSGIEVFFYKTGEIIKDPSALPPNNGNDPARLAKWKATAPMYGLDFSDNIEQYADSVDYNVDPAMIADNHADELISLLRDTPQIVQAVPESSSPLGLLAFGAFGAISMLKRKYKQISGSKAVVEQFTKRC